MRCIKMQINTEWVSLRVIVIFMVIIRKSADYQGVPHRATFYYIPLKIYLAGNGETVVKNEILICY